MTFRESVSTCLSKYVVFKGRASRSEYWLWYLFTLFVGLVAGLMDGLLGLGFMLTSIVTLALLLPSIAVGVRRCHDTNHSGWWFLCPIYNLVLMLMPTED